MPAFRPEPTVVSARPPSDRVMQNLERLAFVMDRAIPIPGTKFRIGLDAILGLLPGGGDFLTGLVQTGLVLTVLNHNRVPKAVAARMAANVLIDMVVGTIPAVGDLFDMGFKANTRNLALLHDVNQRQMRGEAIPSAPSIRYLVGIGVLLIGALGLMAIGLGFLVYWMYRMINPGSH